MQYMSFQRYLSSHQRILKMKNINENELQLEITDIIFSNAILEVKYSFRS